VTDQTFILIVSPIISVSALVVSLLAYNLARRNAVAARRPVVVFEWTDSEGWQINNAGNGPAMNLRVSVRGKHSAWTEEVIVPPIPSGGTFELPWIGKLDAWMLGGEYEDFDGYAYTTISQHDQNLTKSGFNLAAFAEPDKDYVIGRNVRRVWNAEDLSNRPELT
jgi:hypothetical protein